MLGDIVIPTPEVAEAVISVPPEVVPILPTPPEKTGVIVVELPRRREEVPKVKDVASGKGATVISTVDVAVDPVSSDC